MTRKNIKVRRQLTPIHVVTAVMTAAILLIVLILMICLYKRRMWVHKFSSIPGISGTTFGIIGDVLVFARLLNRHNYRNAAPLLQGVSAWCKCIPNQGLIQLWLGPVVVILVTSADAVESVLSSSEITRKGIHYNFLHPWLGSGLLTSYGHQWRSNRKMMTSSFHFKILEQFVPVMHANANILINKLKQEADRNDGVVTDLRPFILRAALDVICETAMGERVNAQDDPYSKYIKAVYRLGHVILKRSFNPILFNDFIFRQTRGGRKSAKSLRIMQGFTDGVIGRRKAAIESANKDVHLTSDLSNTGNRKEPFLDTLIREHLRQPHQFTLRNIRDEVETFMFEGHDTTAWGVIWAMYMIGLHPECQQMIHSEVDSLYEARILAPKSYPFPTSSSLSASSAAAAVTTDTTSSSDMNHNHHLEDEKQTPQEMSRQADDDDMQGHGEEQELTLDDLKLCLPYTEACVKEAQRLYPSVSVFTRETESEFKINETTILPPGVNIAIFPSLIHMNSEYFHDPERFLPERFLSREKRHPFAFIPFSAGPRNCIGQRFAMLEEKALLVTIFRHFKVTSLDPRERVVPCASLITKSSGPIRVRLEVR